jgi:hypothetical protein
MAKQVGLNEDFRDTLGLVCLKSGVPEQIRCKLDEGLGWVSWIHQEMELV